MYSADQGLNFPFFFVTAIYTAVNQTLFQADEHNSYVCNADQTVAFDVSQSNVTMSKVQVQAFMDSTTKDFGTGESSTEELALTCFVVNIKTNLMQNAVECKANFELPTP